MLGKGNPTKTGKAARTGRFVLGHGGPRHHPTTTVVETIEPRKYGALPISVPKDRLGGVTAPHGKSPRRHPSPGTLLARLTLRTAGWSAG